MAGGWQRGGDGHSLCHCGPLLDRVPMSPVSGDISAAPSLQPSHMAPTLGGMLFLGYGGPQHRRGL